MRLPAADSVQTLPGIEWAIRHLVDIVDVQETSLSEQLVSRFAGRAMHASTRKMVQCGV